MNVNYIINTLDMKYILLFSYKGASVAIVTIVIETIYVQIMRAQIRLLQFEAAVFTIPKTHSKSDGSNRGDQIFFSATCPGQVASKNPLVLKDFLLVPKIFQ